MIIMKDKFEVARFKKWRDNFTQNPTLAAITDAALITKEDLKALLVDMDAMGSDSARVYFVRFEKDVDEPQKNKKKVNGVAPPGCTWEEAGNGLTQIALAITPTIGFKIDPDTYIVTANDMTENGSITLLIPGGREEGPTGHNPPPQTQKLEPNP
jgi:hypothetical protein